MARETKVGLIVGLGLILFVGMMISEYFVDSPENQELAANDFANFGDNTTNQTQPPLTRDPQAGQPRAADPADLIAAVALENARQREGQPIDRRVMTRDPISEPPFREMVTIGPPPGAGDTPVARQSHTPPADPIGRFQINERSLALGNQILPERIGPGADTLDTAVRIEIPEHTAIQPRQLLHTVGSGETLSSIARKHYDGDGNLWYSIRDANPGKVGPNGEVREGVRLVIPRRSVTSEDPTGALSSRTPGNTQRAARQRVRMITVKEGQTLSEIASEHLGSGRKWPEIMAVNSDVLDKPEQLRAGMKLRIPAQEQSEVIEQATEALQGNTTTGDQPRRGTGNRYYTVKAGDSLSLIADKQLGSVDRFNEIFEANRNKLNSADDIKVGMKLVIPAR